MTKYILSLIILFQFHIQAQRPAQTIVAQKNTYANIIEINKDGVPESYYTPEELVQNVLLSDCVAISNFSAVVNGNPDENYTKSYGYFHRTPSSSFPFQSGIVLTNGVAYEGANTALGSLPTNDNNMAGDPDLEAALGTTDTYDATIFEFDFVAISNEISFNFLMASSEYHIDWPCTFSDGFAFLIRPAGSSTYTNLALVPGTNTPIACTTVHTDVDEFGNPLSCGAMNEDYFEGYQIGDTNYNGRTLVFTAQGDVVPGETYHIKMVVADEGDSIYDTAIFLQANSFNFGQTNILDVNDNILPDEIDICAPDPLPQLHVVNIPGASYQWQLNGTDIPGATTNVLDIDEEGTYTVNIDQGSCTLTDTVTINEIPIPEVELPEEGVICEGDTFSLDGTLTNANEYSSINYTWTDANNNVVSNSAELNATAAGEYTLSVEVDGLCNKTFDPVTLKYYASCKIPEGISPNGDGLNDVFILDFYAGEFGIDTFQVFDRRGVLVYEKDGYVREFDGKDNDGNELPAATYYYVLKLMNGDKYSGWFELTR